MDLAPTHILLPLCKLGSVWLEQISVKSTEWPVLYIGKHRIPDAAWTRTRPNEWHLDAKIPIGAVTETCIELRVPKDDHVVEFKTKPGEFDIMDRLTDPSIGLVTHCGFATCIPVSSERHSTFMMDES